MLFRSNVESDNTRQSAYADVVQQCPSSKKENGHVNITIYHEKKSSDSEEIMLKEMCSCIQSLHANGLPYSEMAILLRKRKDIQPIVEYFALSAPEVKLVSDEAFLLSASKALNVLIAAQRVLDDDTDDISYNYLAHYCARTINESDVDWNSLLLNKETNYLPDEFITRRESLKMMPLYELQEELMRIFEVKRIEGQEAYIFAYLDQVMQYACEGTPNLSDFLSYWDQKLCNKIGRAHD